MMNVDGGDVRRLTDQPRYDSGAVFSFRASRPQTRDEHVVVPPHGR